MQQEKDGLLRDKTPDEAEEEGVHYRHVAVEDATIKEWMGTGRIKLRIPYCDQCQDTGWVRFYYDRHRPAHVWDKDEALAMPQAQSWALSIGSAVCDCIRGKGGFLPNGIEVKGRWAEVKGAIHPTRGRTVLTMPALRRLLAARPSTLTPAAVEA